MKRVNFLIREEQGAKMSFPNFPRVPAVAGTEGRFAKTGAPIPIPMLLLVCLVVLPRLAAQDAPGGPAKTAIFWKASSGTNVIYFDPAAYPRMASSLCALGICFRRRYSQNGGPLRTVSCSASVLS
jgi:hypothetical protein